MMLIRFFVLSICVALGLCKIRLLTDCPPDKGGLEGGNQLEILKLNVDNCPSSERSCTLTKGDTLSGSLSVKMNFTATALFLTLKVKTKLLGTVTLANKVDCCEGGIATVGKCSKIKPGYQMEFEHSGTIDTRIPDFDGIVKITITDSDDTVRYCGQTHIILVSAEGASPNLVSIIGGLVVK